MSELEMLWQLIAADVLTLDACAHRLAANVARVQAQPAPPPPVAPPAPEEAWRWPTPVWTGAPPCAPLTTGDPPPPRSARDGTTYNPTGDAWAARL